MIKYIKSLLYDLYQIYRYINGKVKLYHYGTGKPRFAMLKELLSWRLQEGVFNSMYYAMGLNLAGSKQSDYIGRREFLRVKNMAEKHLKLQAGCRNLNYDVLCKDKNVSGAFLQANGVACPATLAVIRNGRLYSREFGTDDLAALYSYEHRFILKQITLEAGEGVLCCERVGKEMRVNGVLMGPEHFQRKISTQIWIMQDWLVSHAAIRLINDTALNTMRIVTILNGGEPEYLGGFQAFATHGESTDSWGRGSLYVGINVADNCLQEKGYYNLSLPDVSTAAQHPDTHIVFQGYKLPFLNEAIDLCLRAHRLLYFNFIIGWDVAVTDTGPVIIEANEKPGMDVVQSIGGGMRDKILRYADYTLAYRKFINDTK
jgi:hypothetical protein